MAQTEEGAAMGEKHGKTDLCFNETDMNRHGTWYDLANVYSLKTIYEFKFHNLFLNIKHIEKIAQNVLSCTAPPPPDPLKYVVTHEYSQSVKRTPFSLTFN